MDFQTNRFAPASRFCAGLLIFATIIATATDTTCCGATREELEKSFSFESLLPRAGKPDRGLVLEVRLTGDIAMSNALLTFILSIKSVCEEPHEICFVDLPVKPEAFVRDEDGNPAALTEEGTKWYKDPWWRRALEGNNPFLKLGPGEATGATFELSRYSRLDKPGRYTVLFWVPSVQSMEDLKKNIDLMHGGTLVAKPVVIRVKRSANGGSEIREVQSHAAGPMKPDEIKWPTDNEWTSLARRAGKLDRGCVLEALDSPIDPAKGKLFVSVVFLEAELDGRTLRVPDPEDFRVLVRDRRGRPVDPIARAPAEPPKKSGDDRFKSLFQGGAVGAMIALSKRFNLKEPGEYSVLVSLPTGRAGEPDWVTKPIHLKVGADSSAPIQEK